MSFPSAEQLERHPVFPLPGAVFFPGTLMPLHIFEPRYCAMIRDSVERGWPVSIAMIEPGQEHQHLDAPPILPVATIGEIVGHRELPDGRFHMVLKGAARVTLEELTSAHPYRMVRAEILENRWPENIPGLKVSAETIHALLASLSRHAPRIAELTASAPLRELEPDVLSDLLASLIFDVPAERQALLETLEVDARLTRIIERLAALLSAASEPGEFLN